MNLATALKYFRDRRSHVEASMSDFIASCLSQADNDEKSIQVRQMDQIREQRSSCCPV
jgi:hypothetical protein